LPEHFVAKNVGQFVRVIAGVNGEDHQRLDAGRASRAALNLTIGSNELFESPSFDLQGDLEGWFVCVSFPECSWHR